MTGRVLLHDLPYLSERLSSGFPLLPPSLCLPSASLAWLHWRTELPGSIPTSPRWLVTLVTGQCTDGVFPPSQTALLDRAVLGLHSGWKALSKSTTCRLTEMLTLCSNVTFPKCPSKTIQLKISPHNLVPHQSFLVLSLCSIFSIVLIAHWLFAKSLQLCLTPGSPMDCSPPSSSVHKILQARILEWVAMPSSRGSFWLRNWTCISYVSCIDRRVLYH